MIHRGAFDSDASISQRIIHRRKRGADNVSVLVPNFSESGDYLKPQKLPKIILERVRRLRRRATLPENVIRRALHELGVPYRFQYALQTFGKWYILDFYVPSKKVAIEADGSSHRKPGAAEYDQLRDDRLKARGIRTVRIENELLHNVMQATYLIGRELK